MFLDVDDTLLMFRGKGKPAPLAKEFFEWASENFELRCLTMWAPCGEFIPERVIELSDILKVDVNLVLNFRNPKAFSAWGKKTEALDFQGELKNREWVWIEDALIKEEIQILKGNHVFGNYIHCNVTANPWRLVEVWGILEKRFNIPVPKEIKERARKTIRWD